MNMVWVAGRAEVVESSPVLRCMALLHAPDALMLRCSAVLLRSAANQRKPNLNTAQGRSSAPAQAQP